MANYMGPFIGVLIVIRGRYCLLFIRVSHLQSFPSLFRCSDIPSLLRDLHFPMRFVFEVVYQGFVLLSTRLSFFFQLLRLRLVSFFRC